MKDLSIAMVEQPACANRERPRQFIALLTDLMRRICARRCLVAELHKMSEEALQDIDLLQADVVLLRETPVFGDGINELAACLRARLATRDQAMT